MKRFKNIILVILVCVIFIPLFLLMLFGGPVELIAATWHNIRSDASTKGTVTFSESTRHSGLTGSSISYRYEVGGSSYESQKWRTGFSNNSSYENGGNYFAKNHPEGSAVVVYYDSSEPTFSILERGWPTFSIGFSMACWGILLCHNFKRNDPKTAYLMIGYPISRALLGTGVLTLFTQPPTIKFELFNPPLVCFLIITTCAVIILLSSKAEIQHSEELPSKDKL